MQRDVNIPDLQQARNLSNLINEIVYILDCKNDITKEFLKQAITNAVLFDKKQTDYGPRNISGFGLFGVVVRMNDKFERLKTYYNPANTKGKMENESLEDTFRDISNYANIALLIHKDLWPK
jgi:hypothetical protein